jgi:hypothetical protein
VSYQWLSDKETPALALGWVQRKEVAKQLKTDLPRLTIRDDGSITGPIFF